MIGNENIEFSKKDYESMVSTLTSTQINNATIETTKFVRNENSIEKVEEKSL